MCHHSRRDMMKPRNPSANGHGAAVSWYERRPLVALAPMEAVTDSPYRRIVRAIAPEAVLYTEFTPARGLLAGAERVWRMVHFEESERPVIVQLYDNLPETLGEAVSEIGKRYRPDGYDLNMGCPVRKVASRGAGCGMLATPDVAADAVRHMIERADGVPVSIKTRLGIHDKTQVVEVAHACVEAGAVQVSIHARLKADRPKVPADWDALARAAAQIPVTVIGNGDVWTVRDARRMVELPGVDGVMIARAGIGNPWLLRRCCQALAGRELDPLPTREEKARVAMEHLRANVAEKGERRGVLEMRKVVRNYIKGHIDSKRTWMRIIDVESEVDTLAALEQFAAGPEQRKHEPRTVPS
ncbi:MAG: putative tRNA-dihydrouridine synthase [Calditrichaeota bacterium]|nr:putative tRNA-dihydrouridine synthase [Calditrichota bacterium]